MAEQDIYKLVEQMNKNKSISEESKIDDIYNLLDDINSKEKSNTNIKLDSEVKEKKSKAKLADLKEDIREIKKVTYPSEIRPYDKRSDCFINIIQAVDYGTDNNADYVKGHKQALEKYYSLAKNNTDDLFVVEGKCNDELADFVSASRENNLNKGYYDGLNYISWALNKSKSLISKRIYESLIKELN